MTNVNKMTTFSVVLIVALLASVASFRSNTPDQNAFIEAVRAGRFAEVRDFVNNKKVPVDTLDKRGFETALIVAVHTNQSLQIVRFLLHSGASVNATDRDLRSSALAWAVKNGHHGVIRLLLDRKANVNGQLMCSSILTIAASSCNATLVRLLLERGADPNGAPSGGGYPIEPIRMCPKSYPILEMLVNAKANLCTRSSRTGYLRIIPFYENYVSDNPGAIPLLLRNGADKC